MLKLSVGICPHKTDSTNPRELNKRQSISGPAASPRSARDAAEYQLRETERITGSSSDLISDERTQKPSDSALVYPIHTSPASTIHRGNSRSNYSLNGVIKAITSEKAT